MKNNLKVILKKIFSSEAPRSKIRGASRRNSPQQAAGNFGIKERRSIEMPSEEEKMVDFERLKKIVVNHKINGDKIVWANGCFDILHTGHLAYLKKAKELGCILIVGIDSDDSVRKLKGVGRPINSEFDRAKILSAFEFINYITIFQFGTVKDYLRELQPHVYVKGGDYNINTINQGEREVIENYGGEIVIVPLVPNKSTTKIIQKIKANNENV